jgi:tetratricopeptide (TPR) repeat protein
MGEVINSSRRVRTRVRLRLFTGLALLTCLVGAPAVGRTHPHLTPEQIQARIRELDALVPVVKRMRLELILERAALYTRLGQLVDGLLDCRRANHLDAASAKPHRQAGEMLEVRAAYAFAAAEYERAVALDPTDERTYWRLANCYREQKRYTEAEAMFRKAAELARDDLSRAARWLDVAKAAEIAGDFKGAEKALTVAIRLSKGWPSYRQARGELYMRMKEYGKAAEDFAAIVAKATDGADEFPMMVLHADALAAAKEAPAARAAYQKADKVITKLLGEDPAFVEDLHYWRGRARLALGDLEGARADAKEALLGLPDQVEYLELMVAIGRKGGETTETKRAAKELVSARAFEKKSRERFAEEQGKMREVVKAALEQASEEVLAEVMLERGLHKVAEDEAAGRRLLALALKKLDTLGSKHPDRKVPYDADRARVKLGLGDARGALEILERCLKADAEDARYRRLRLQAAASLGLDAVVARDRKYLDGLIKRSQEEDLLQAEPPQREKEGQRG